MIHIWVDIVYILYFIVCIMATGAYLCVFCLFLFCFVSSFCILWMASIVDLWVFWQPGSVTVGVELPWLLFNVYLRQTTIFFIFFFFIHTV